MSQEKLVGSFVALITPFNRDGKVDFAAFRELFAWHETHGTSAVLMMGSTGEVSMLSPVRISPASWSMYLRRVLLSPPLFPSAMTVAKFEAVGMPRRAAYHSSLPCSQL